MPPTSSDAGVARKAEQAGQMLHADSATRTLGTPGHLDSVRWIDLPSHGDARGVLTAIEGARDIPFDVKRVYLLHDIANDRGGHAHRDTHQLVIAAAGRFDLVLSDDRETRTYALDNAARGLYLVPMLFIELKNFSSDAVAVVLASTHYDKSRSLRSWEAYREARGF